MSKHLSNYLRTFRKRSGLAQHELAALLGCKHGSKVSRYERGDRIPGLDTLLAYDLVFQKPLRDLFAGEHDRVRQTVKRRAQTLYRRLDGNPKLTPALRRKLDFLTDLIYPPKT